MKEIQLTIKALSPLAIGRQKPGGSISEAQDYIPGAVIRGAVAGQILRTPGVDPEQPGGDFQTLFVDEDAAIFSNAYPTSKNDQGHILPVRVLPATAVSSKTTPGFKTEKPDKNSGVFDTLIDRFCAENYGQLYDPNCPTDGGRVEPFSGFYSIEETEEAKEIYRLQSVETRLLTRVGINRRRNTAQEKFLYSIEVINEAKKGGKLENLFSSTIRLQDNKLAQDLAEYIEQRSDELRLGGSASRGLGKVKIKAKLRDHQSYLEDRVDTFNYLLRKRWETNWKVFGSPLTSFPEDRTFFTLNLQADAILTEQWRRTTVISPAMLCVMTGVNDSGLKLHATYSSYDYRSGWNAAWGLMKDAELVTNKGSVYLFSTVKIEDWKPALEILEHQGVGERTLEGFGQVQVCDEFHNILFGKDIA